MNIARPFWSAAGVVPAQTGPLPFPVVLLAVGDAAFQRQCNRYLQAELETLGKGTVVLALGTIAHQAGLLALALVIAVASVTSVAFFADRGYADDGRHEG